MADLTIKQNDTWPPLTAFLSDAVGPIDLTNATQVKMLMKSDTGTVGGLCELDTNPVSGVTINRATGQVFYIWTPADTASPGLYDVEFEITWGTTPATVETVPNDAYDQVAVVADLG